MSKETIVIGNAVDDGTGDYLRRGGQKINSNFTELYGELGDGEVPHAAGAWKRYSTVGTPLSVVFGKSYTIDTTGGQITVNLPAGKPSDYGKVVRLRDVNGSWATNPVTLVPGGTDTVKGTSAKHKLWKNYLDAELVYCSPGKWEYADNKRVNGISTANGATVAKKEFIATEGQTDFINIFESSYNPGAVEVYRRGNLLYYGDRITENTDYGSMTIKTPTVGDIVISGGVKNNTAGYATGIIGSIDPAKNKVEGIAIVDFRCEISTNTVLLQFANGAKPIDANVIYVESDTGGPWFLQYDSSRTAYTGVYADLVTKLSNTASQNYKISIYRLNTLDGYSIRLADPCFAGDVITVVTYLDGIASYRSSYQRYTLRVYDEKLTTTDIKTIPGQRWVGDLPNKSRFSLNDFDLLENETYNPFSIEILINGRTLTRAGEGDLPAFICEGADANNETACISQGGAWVPSGGDFSTVTDLNDRYREFVINQDLNHKDIITIRWYNNDIGTTLDWDGDGGIKFLADERYLVSERKFSRDGKIMYKDLLNPSSSNVVANPEKEELIRFTSVDSLLESIYPVGSIYMNANNSNNPKSFMGFGEWRRFAPGRTVVSWNDDPNDPNFSLNINDKDVNGNPRASAGNTGGSITNTLSITNIPPITSNEKALIVDPTGDVLVGGCQFDPDDEGPGFKRYREDLVKARPSEIALPINNLQPFITVHMWIRVL